MLQGGEQSDFRADERGATVQIGAVLLFGIIIISMAIYQSAAVPDQNGGAEFEHSLEVQADLLDLRNALLQTGASGTTRPVSVDLAARYPDRTVFVNPAPPTGTLRTGPNETLTVSGAAALQNETDDYWNGTTRQFSTRALRYEPHYNEYESAPTTVLEHTVVYNRFENGANLTLSEQSMVDGKRITLVTVEGDLSETSTQDLSVDPESLSPSTTSIRTVTVANESGPVTLTIPTSLPLAKWQDLLADERHVTSVQQNGTAIDVVLEAGVEYELRMMHLGVGTDTDPVESAYLTRVTEDTTVESGGQKQLVVEVRDRFNNPVNGVDVDASVVSGGGSLDQSTVTSDSDGRARFTYTAPRNGGDATVRMRIDGDGTASERVTFDVSTSGSGGSAPYAIRWQRLSERPGAQSTPARCGASPCEGIDLGAVTDPATQGEVVALYSTDESIVRVDETQNLEVTGGAGNVSTRTVGGPYWQNYSNGVASLIAKSDGGSDSLRVHNLHLADFEGGSLSDAGWTASGDTANVEVSGPSDHRGDDANSGTYALRFGGPYGSSTGSRSKSATSPAFDTTQYDMVVVDYWVRGGDGQEDPETGEDLHVEYRAANGSWVELETYVAPPDGDEQFARAMLTADAARHSNFAIRFRQDGTSGEDAYYVDDVMIRGFGGGSNLPPRADAGGPYVVDEGTTGSLSAAGSRDPDGSLTTYEWTIVNDSTGGASLADATTASPTFTAPSDVTGDATVTVQLTVTDDAGTTDTQTVEVTVRDTDRYPVSWRDPVVAPGAKANPPENCGPGCAPLALSTGLTRPASGQTVNFETGDATVAALNASSDVTNSGGHATVGVVSENYWTEYVEGSTTLTARSNRASDTIRVTNHLITDFEADSLSGTRWTTQFDGSNVTLSSNGEHRGADHNSGTTALRLGGPYDSSKGSEVKAAVSPLVDTSDDRLVTIEYWWRVGRDIESPDADENAYVQYLNASGAWVTVDTITEADSTEGRFKRIRLTDPDARHQNFAIRIGQTATSGEDAYYVDDVKITGVGAAGSQAPESVAWRGAYDWDIATSESAVVHETNTDTDWPGAATVKLGHSPTDDGLVSYYPLDENSGTVAHDVTGNNPGTSNGVILGQNGMVSTTAYEFDGSRDRIDLGGMDVTGGGITIAAWANADSYGNRDGRIVSKTTGTRESRHYWMLSEENGRLRMRVKTAGGTTTTVHASSGTLPTNEWYHAAGTYDGKTVRLYLNGELVGSEVLSAANDGPLATNPNVDAYIGRNPGSTPQRWDGRLDEVRIYDRALSQDEITELDATGREGELVTEWKSAARLDASNLELRNVDASVAGATSVTVRVQIDTDGDGVVDQTSQAVQLNGNGGPYQVQGLTQDATRYRLQVVLSTRDRTQSSTFSGAELGER